MSKAKAKPVKERRCGYIEAVPPGWGMARCIFKKGHPIPHKFAPSKPIKEARREKPLELSDVECWHLASALDVYEADGSRKLLHKIGQRGEHLHRLGTAAHPGWK